MKLLLQLSLALWIIFIMVMGIVRIYPLSFDSLVSADFLFLLVTSSICYTVISSGRNHG
jgi:hypothetical protein